MNLLSLNYEELEKIMLELNEPKYRVKQLFLALHNGLKFDEMTNFGKELRAKLATLYDDFPIKIHSKFVSKDKTIKFLYSLNDGNIIEGVLMNYKYGNTLCVSTQVGCRMGCKFCASTIGGFVRNLDAGEILGQIVAVNRFLGGNILKRQITNVVLMGSGEPFDNYDNVVKFLRLLTDERGINVSIRNVSLSTCGLVDKIYDFAKEGLPLNLTISLHEPFDSERQEIMPVAKKYKISEILSACDHYFEVTGRRFIFEYTLIRGVNDDNRHVEELCKILKGRPCHLNIIRLNEVKDIALKASADKHVYAFCEELEKRGISATVRRQMGLDIEGACGQLRRKVLGDV